MDGPQPSPSGLDFAADFLEHYGVKGMKWGRRKGDASSGSKTPKSPPSEDYTTAAKLSSQAKKSGSKSLSNKEMQAVVTRMNLEGQYSKLSSQKSFLGKVKNGNDLVKAVLAVGATANAVIAFAQSPVGKRIAENLKNNAATKAG